MTAGRAPDAGRNVAGVVLAAGEGRRLGTPKALFDVGGELLVERAVGLLRAGGCDPVLVVLGAAAGQVRARADLGGAEVVVNGRWRQGMGSSLATALEELADRPHAPGAVIVALVDQPGAAPEAVSRLIRAWWAGAPIAAASYEGRRGNPVLLDRAVWDDALAHAEGDAGARALLDQRPDIVQLVPCDDVADPRDIDTAADLAALRREGLEARRSPCS